MRYIFGAKPQSIDQVVEDVDQKPENPYILAMSSSNQEEEQATEATMEKPLLNISSGEQIQVKKARVQTAKCHRRLQSLD